MKIHTLLFALVMASGCVGGLDRSGTGGSTTVDALDRTTPTDSNQTSNNDAARDTADTGSRKSYPSGG